MPFEIPQGVQIDPGTYRAQLEKVEPYTHPTYGDGRKWHWIVDVEGEATPLSVITSGNTGPQSKSYQWLTALLGRSPQAGETIQDPTGKTVLLAIGKNEKGFPKVDSVMSLVEPTQVEAGIPR